MAAVHESARIDPAKAGQGSAQHATRSAQRATILGILGLLAVLSVGRMLATAFGYGVPAWFDEELNPLIGWITAGQPIDHVDARQYGVVVFLVFDPSLRILGANLPGLATYATAVALAASLAALVLIGRRYAADDPADRKSVV